MWYEALLEDSTFVKDIKKGIVKSSRPRRLLHTKMLWRKCVLKKASFFKAVAYCLSGNRFTNWFWISVSVYGHCCQSDCLMKLVFMLGWLCLNPVLFDGEVWSLKMNYGITKTEEMVVKKEPFLQLFYRDLLELILHNCELWSSGYIANIWRDISNWLKSPHP